MSDDARQHVCLVDMDGTLCDFNEAMEDAMESLLTRDEIERRDDFGEYSRDDPGMKARRRLIKSQPGFWANMEPIRHGFELLGLAEGLGFECHILTKGPNSTPSAWTEKKEWCNQHVPGLDVHICGAKKSLVYGRVLLDDWPAFFMPWLEVRPRGLVVAVAQPWNEDARHPRLIRYDGTNISEVSDRMKAALSE